MPPVSGVDPAVPGPGRQGPRTFLVDDDDPARPRRPEVLVVDDEPAVLRLLEIALRHHGFRVLSATGGREALRLFAEHRGTVRMILVDVQMPDMDGPATLAALRALDPSVPAYFMTGNAGSYSAGDLWACGARDVFPKPFRSLTDLCAQLWAAATGGG